MTPELEILWRVHELDRELSLVRERLAAFPAQRAAQAARVSTAKDAVGRAEGEGKARALAKREAESQAEALVAQERKFQTQLTQVKKNEEYSALLAEIEAAKKRRSELETFVLERMEEEGAAADRLLAARAALAEVETRVQAERAALEAEEARLKGEESGLAERRSGELAGLPAALRSRYERVHAAKKGQAVADLAGDSCSACGSRLPPQAAIEVRRGSAVVECPDCGRILLHRADVGSSR